MPIRNRKLVLACVVAAIPVIAARYQQAHAQPTGRITGQVNDAVTGESVADVMVAVLGSTIAVGTDEDGLYSIDSIVPGFIRSRAQLLGYLPITTDYYSVFPDTSVVVDFKLAPNAYELDPVEITAPEPGRRWQLQQGAQLFTVEQPPSAGTFSMRSRESCRESGSPAAEKTRDSSSAGRKLRFSACSTARP